nr:uncharacterized protein LOC112763924 [Arachis hypogaea]
MKYDHVVTTILESHDMDTMTIAELQGTMENYISRILEKSEKSIEEALKSRVNLNNVAESSHQLRKKLDDKGEKCIFIGYSTDSKAYKLYNPETKKVIISRDVTFDEKDMWDWNTKTKKQLTIIPNTCDEVEER